MSYSVICRAEGCDFEGWFGNHRGERLANAKCPKCGGALRRPGVAGARKRQHCFVCQAITEAVVPDNLGPVGVTDRFGWIGGHEVIIVAMAMGGEPICRDHSLVTQDGGETWRVKPGQVSAGMVIRSEYRQGWNLEALAAYRDRQAASEAAS